MNVCIHLIVVEICSVYTKSGATTDKQMKIQKRVYSVFAIFPCIILAAQTQTEPAGYTCNQM